MDLQELEKTSPFALGKENTGYAQYFDGKSYLNMLTLQQVVTAVVTFEPGAAGIIGTSTMQSTEAGRSSSSPPDGAITRNGESRPRN